MDFDELTGPRVTGKTSTLERGILSKPILCRKSGEMMKKEIDGTTVAKFGQLRLGSVFISGGCLFEKIEPVWHDGMDRNARKLNFNYRPIGLDWFPADYIIEGIQEVMF